MRVAQRPPARDGQVDRLRVGWRGGRGAPWRPRDGPPAPGYSRASSVLRFSDGWLGSPIPMALAATVRNSYSTQGFRPTTVAVNVLPSMSSGTERQWRDSLWGRRGLASARPCHQGTAGDPRGRVNDCLRAGGHPRTLPDWRLRHPRATSQSTRPRGPKRRDRDRWDRVPCLQHGPHSEGHTDASSRPAYAQGARAVFVALRGGRAPQRPRGFPRPRGFAPLSARGLSSSTHNGVRTCAPRSSCWDLGSTPKERVGWKRKRMPGVGHTRWGRGAEPAGLTQQRLGTGSSATGQGPDVTAVTLRTPLCAPCPAFGVFT